MKRRAFIGDVHGGLKQLERLYDMLGAYSLDAIEHVGDLVDRGPDPQGVVQFCREKNIHGVLGNHESVILQYMPGGKMAGKIPKNEDKARTIAALNELDVEYLRTLPYYKIHDDALLQVHAGVNPFQPLTDQYLNKMRHVQLAAIGLVHPEHPKESKWFRETQNGVKEEDLRVLGWKRWYELYNQPYDLVFGHNVWSHGQAFQYEAPNGKLLAGIDTGGWFSKNLTAFIYPDCFYVSTLLGEYFLPESQTGYVREPVYEKKEGDIVLSNADFDRLVEHLADPSPPSPLLVEAFRKYKESQGS